jgi:hypothetical protein
MPELELLTPRENLERILEEARAYYKKKWLI